MTDRTDLPVDLEDDTSPGEGRTVITPPEREPWHLHIPRLFSQGDHEWPDDLDGPNAEGGYAARLNELRSATTSKPLQYMDRVLTPEEHDEVAIQLRDAAEHPAHQGPEPARDARRQHLNALADRAEKHGAKAIVVAQAADEDIPPWERSNATQPVESAPASQPSAEETGRVGSFARPQVRSRTAVDMPYVDYDKLPNPEATIANQRKWLLSHPPDSIPQYNPLKKYNSFEKMLGPRLPNTQTIREISDDFERRVAEWRRPRKE